MKSLEINQPQPEEEKSEEQLLTDLLELCQPVLSDAAFEDLQEAMDFEQAINLAVTFLAEEGLDPEEFLLSNGFVL